MKPTIFLEQNFLCFKNNLSLSFFGSSLGVSKMKIQNILQNNVSWGQGAMPLTRSFSLPWCSFTKIKMNSTSDSMPATFSSTYSAVVCDITVQIRSWKTDLWELSAKRCWLRAVHNPQELTHPPGGIQMNASDCTQGKVRVLHPLWMQNPQRTDSTMRWQSLRWKRSFQTNWPFP